MSSNIAISAISAIALSSFHLLAKEDKSLDGLAYRKTKTPWRKFRRIDNARNEEPPNYAAKAEQFPVIMVNAQPVWEETPDDILYSKLEDEDPANDKATGKKWQYV
ncbi:hypothetical protein F5B17DRAFT_427808 [Nemania serpens]|nr:hypothetical protein F5B17DRAFT_427808 [Nemania serpens]